MRQSSDHNFASYWRTPVASTRLCDQVKRWEMDTGVRRYDATGGRRGFSILELAIVLAVAGAIFGGVWAGISSAGSKGKTVQAIEQIIILNKNIRGFYQNQACIAATGDLTAGLLAANNPPVIPREMQLGGAAVSPWLQPFVVRRFGAAGCGAAAAFQYTLEYQNLPPDACIALVMKVTRAGELSRGLVSVAINNAAPLTALPPTVAAISGNAVGTCGENATALVDFTYNLRMGD